MLLRVRAVQKRNIFSNQCNIESWQSDGEKRTNISHFLFFSHLTWQPRNKKTDHSILCIAFYKENVVVFNRMNRFQILNLSWFHSTHSIISLKLYNFWHHWNWNLHNVNEKLSIFISISSIVSVIICAKKESASTNSNKKIELKWSVVCAQMAAFQL